MPRSGGASFGPEVSRGVEPYSLGDSQRKVMGLAGLDLPTFAESRAAWSGLAS